MANFYKYAFVLCGCTLCSCNNNSNFDKSAKHEVASYLRKINDPISVKKFSRYYCNRSDKGVNGVFVIHTQSEIGAAKRYCLAFGGSVYPCRGTSIDMAPPGKARWLKTCDQMPIWNDGGCSYISFNYNSKDRQFKNIKCNETN